MKKIVNDFITFAAEKIQVFGNIIHFILLKMKKERIILGVAFLVLACTAIPAQETAAARPQIFINLAQNDEESGQIEIIQPAQVEDLLKMQIANNRLLKKIPGYRIRIFSESVQTARQHAIDTRANFMRNFPDIDAYIEHQPPNFKVIVGDFRTKNEALREKKKIEKQYPGAFIISDMIEIFK